MPDASGRFRGISVPAEAWERVFGRKRCPRDSGWCDGVICRELEFKPDCPNADPPC